ncbi:MAG: hypothetical protein V7K97_09940 [Nostoc sp.]
METAISDILKLGMNETAQRLKPHRIRSQQGELNGKGSIADWGQ